MNLKRNILNYAMNFILALALCFSFVYALTESMGLKYSPFYILLAISCLYILYTLISYNKLVFRISGIVILAAAAGTIFLLFYRFRPYADAFIDWFYRAIILQEVIKDPTFSFILTILICILLSPFTFFFTVKKFRFIPILIFGSLLFTTQWMLDFLVSYMSFYLFVLVILVYYFNHIYTKNSSKEVNEYAQPALFTVYAVPVCAIILIISFLIPASSKPIEWKWLDTKISKLYNYIANGGSTYKFDYFSVASSGFGDGDGNLGGKVKKDKTYVLKVDSPRPLYLKASVKDKYTGSKWEESEDSDTTSYSAFQNISSFDYDNILKTLNDSYSFDVSNVSSAIKLNRSFADYVEMLAGMSILSNDEDFLNKYFFTDNVKVTYQNILTRSLFFSNNFFNVNINNVDVKSKQNGVILSEKRLSKKFNYSYTAYTLKSGDEKLIKLLKESHRGLYEDYYNDISNLSKELYDAAVRVSNSPEPAYELFDNYGYKALIFSITSGENLNNTIKQALSQYGVSPENNNIMQYNIDNPHNNTVFIAPLNEETANYPSFKIKGKEFSELQFLIVVHGLLIRNSEEAYQKYLQLPNTLPERVKGLALSITSSYNNQYDKVKAVEKYLSSNYPYTLSPKSTPKGRDFVDYFLFDIKEGYCTYYASSMAVLLRCAGIPARYVEGYALSSRPKSGTIYTVTNDKAHAWVEVYFEGVGWIPFEPTSSFGNSFYGNRTSASGKSPYSKFGDGRDPNRTRPSIPELNGDGTNQNQYQTYAKAKNIPVWRIIIITICVIVLITAVIILINSIKGFIRSRKPAKLSPKESIIGYYKYYLALLSSAGLEILPGETPIVYSERIDKYLTSKPTSFESLTKVFMLARYSPDPLSEKEKELVKSYMPEITEKIRYRLGKLKYFIYKYIMGKI